MPTLFTLSCSCGEVLQLYVPKRVIGELLGRNEPELEALASIDTAEQATGSIQRLADVASRTGLKFIDSRQGKICPTCGQTFSYTELLLELRLN